MVVEKKFAKSALVTLSGLVLLVGIYYRYAHPELPFARIGGFLGLIAVVALIFQQVLAAFGGGFAEDPNHWTMKSSRNLAIVLLFLFLPLTVIAAWYQFIDLSDSEQVTSIKPDEIIKPSDSFLGRSYKVNYPGLVAHLKDNATNYEAIKRKVDQIDQLWFPQLLIVNCGASRDCQCPDGYKQVDYRINWDLNAGIAGKAGASVVSDKVNLCWREVTYNNAASKR